MKNLPTLRNDSSFTVQFSISVSKTRAILLFKIKIKLIEMFELNERMPGMRSAEYQATIPLKFFIIIHNYANVQTINQSKSLPSFRVVSDVTGHGRPVDSDVVERRKQLEAIEWISGQKKCFFQNCQCPEHSIFRIASGKKVQLHVSEL